MGQYFYFFNITKNIKNTKGIRTNYDFLWVKNLHLFQYCDIINVFEELIAENDWSYNDGIIARGNKGTNLFFEKGIVNLEYVEILDCIR